MPSPCSTSFTQNPLSTASAFASAKDAPRAIYTNTAYFPRETGLFRPDRNPSFPSAFSLMRWITEYMSTTHIDPFS